MGEEKEEEEVGTLYTPTQRFRSNTKPALQEHLKLPSVFRQSPFWHTPWMVHSLMSATSGGGPGQFTEQKKTQKTSIIFLRLTRGTLAVGAVEPLVALRAGGVIVFHDSLLDGRV